MHCEGWKRVLCIVEDKKMIMAVCIVCWVMWAGDNKLINSTLFRRN